MTLSGNTILITGGTSGLGFEMAKQFIEKGNKVIVCSRSEEKLDEAKRLLPQIITFQCDISQESERLNLIQWITGNHAQLNMLINNAAITHNMNFSADNQSYEKCMAEINTNLIAPIHLAKLFIPILSRNSNAAIVNITTGLVYVPRTIYPFYNATKAALHSFTQVLRNQLEKESVKIVEVLFPAVDTPWHKGNPPKIAISPEKAVSEMLVQLAKGNPEIKVGGVKILYYLSRLAPKFAFKKINSLK